MIIENGRVKIGQWKEQQMLTEFLNNVVTCEPKTLKYEAWRTEAMKSADKMLYPTFFL